MIEYILKPITHFKQFLLKLSGNTQNNNLNITENFESIITKTNLSSDERYLFTNLFAIKDIEIENIMLPRSEVVAVHENADLFTIFDTFTGKNFKQVLVYKKNLDNIIGYILLKDILKFAKKPKDFSIRKVLKEVSFIAPSMKCLETLIHMQNTHKTFFVVVDEFGGVYGVLSIENIVSKLFGDIKDYSFDKVTYMHKNSDGTYTVDARMNLEEFESKLGIQLLNDHEFDDLEVDTIGGFIMFLAGKLPSLGEKITHKNSGLVFRIIDIDPRRIKKVEATINKS